MKKIAIIGASTGQLPICKKANEMGLETHCFAWEKGAICKDAVDFFHPVSILDKDKIVEICQSIGINGVVTNASEMCVLASSQVAERLGLICTPYEVLENIRRKDYVRTQTNNINGLTPVKINSGKFKNIISQISLPCILKPITGSAKRGVWYVNHDTKEEAIKEIDPDAYYMAEEFVDGNEYSVESISYEGKHYVVQITEKESSGAPHFVELSHHQPANIGRSLEKKIHSLIPEILNSVGFENGASHIEIKINGNEIYLIEINPRGGGDFISNTLTSLSTDCDYLRSMIEVALGEFKPTEINNTGFCGVYFLMSQTSRLMPYFSGDYPWLYERELYSGDLLEAKTNYDHNGYIIYKNKINPIKI